MIQNVILDNPTSLGGTAAASIEFQADNEFNFESAGLDLLNVNGLANPTCTVNVQNGDIRSGTDGSTLQTGPNNLNKVVVTAQVDSLSDDVSAGGPLPLTKTGGGVLAIGGNNSTTSLAPKLVVGGTLRFLTANSYGTTTGVNGGPAVTVTLENSGGPGIVSSALGIGYATGVPANLQSVGTVVGQSGAFDIDFLGDAAPVAENFINTIGGLTALRIGSSGNGSLSGNVTPYESPGGATGYYLGGGGGTLNITSTLMNYGQTDLEMGTTGNLLPGLVKLSPAVAEAYPGQNYLRAGTLEVLKAGILAPTFGTALAPYSSALTIGSAYSGAPAADPYNGPSQLLLSPTVAYVYGAGGSFGGAGLSLDGGAVGYTGSVNLAALPGAYGGTLNSELYQTVLPAPNAVATNILHFGGEYSAGTITTTFAITDNLGGPAPVPVALLKSGINSILDLTHGPVNTYSGGTGIMGGAIDINNDSDLGPAPVTITDGGILNVIGGAPFNFNQVLKVANGPQGEGSVVNIVGGDIVSLNGGNSLIAGSLQAVNQQSILEKEGAGTLDMLPGFFFPNGVRQTAPPIAGG